jgi:hypothetical protein
MAHSTLYLINPTTGQRKQAPVGFSWTNLLFGPIPALVRQDWLVGIGLFFLGVALSLLALNWVLWILQGFFYNKNYIERMISQGFVVENHSGRPLSQLETDLGMMLPRVAQT